MSLQVNPITHNNPIFFLLTAVVLTAVGSEDAGGGGGGGGRSSVVGGGGGLELLALLQLHNGSRQGVTLTQGPHRMRPAYYLQGSYRELRLPDFAYKKAVDLLRHSTEFTLSASIKQELYNSGTILAFSDGVNRYLEVQSSGRKDEIRLHYTTQREAGEDSGSPTVKEEGGWTVRVETFPYRLADLSWHKLSISVSGSQVQVLVDCHPLYRRLLATPLDTNFSRSSLVLWVGQRNARHSLFKGGLQDVKIVGGPHGYLGQCPQLDVGCPTCGQYTTLEDTVQRLTARLNNLSARLEMAEGRITKVEECDCQKSCSINGSTHADGATWQHNCEICSCVHGDVECRPVQCPKIECKKPVLNPGQCCPTCLKQCYLRGTLYDHGDLVSLKQCVECECRDGSMHCTRIDPETMCPPLSCPQHVQFSVPDECCKFCPGVDYCGKGHTCHANASCLNLETTYACHCDTGFTGDGHNCVDIDECLSEGGLEGHHCRSNTRCHNTPGSYQCQCLPGHRTVDRFNCAEIDECATDQHKCDPHAKCINTQGSYHCQCLEGYAGDGYQCLPVCAEVCENGGRCVDGGVCECRAGYHGSGCQLDVDECSAGLHTCNNATSTCVNMPGWYYCTCAPGYTSVVTVVQSQPVTICQDVDECQLGNHTCHPSAKCVNTQGSYKCICPPLSKGLNNTQANCKLSCWLGEDKGEIEDGGTLVRPKDCQECHCSAGVATCRKSHCDCSTTDPPPNPVCCPQCDPSASCSHQELAHLTFRSGEQWIYQCQTCECLLGEIDCWQVECAPIWCETQVLGTTDCCPRCANEDPCGLSTFPTVTNQSQPNQRHFQQGGQLTQRPCPPLSPAAPAGRTAHWADNDCPNCNCKEPFCELLVSNMAFCVHRREGYAAAVTLWVALLVLALAGNSCRHPTPPPRDTTSQSKRTLLLLCVSTVVRILPPVVVDSSRRPTVHRLIAAPS